MRVMTDTGERNVMVDEPAPLMWKWLVLRRDSGCVMADSKLPCEGDLQAHHVVTQQQIRRLGRDDLRWDVRNGLALCERHHRRHTRALTRVPFELLHPDNVAFADELRVLWILERYYPRTREAA